jgi:predicted DNA-binding transcriptional regulator AlpA
MELMSLTDIAELLGMSRQGADQLVKREVTFPAPAVVLTGRTRAWEREAVGRWARETGRIKLDVIEKLILIALQRSPVPRTTQELQDAIGGGPERATKALTSAQHKGWIGQVQTDDGPCWAISPEGEAALEAG